MKGRDELYILQDMANLAKTLIDTGDGEARDAARPIIAEIKSQFTGSNQTSPQTESACSQVEATGPNPHYDPVAAAAERLRLAMVAQKQAMVERDTNGQTTESLENKVRETTSARIQAQGELIRAIEATSRA